MMLTQAMPEESVESREPNRLVESIRSMLPSTLLLHSDKIYAAIASVGALGSGGVFVATAGEEGIAKYGAAGCLLVCASVATAFWKTRAGTIKAQADATASLAATQEAATKALIDRMTSANEKQVAQLEKALEYARDRADMAEQIAHNERIGKHDAVDQLYALAMHAKLLDEICREKHLDVPPLPEIQFGKIVRGADAKASKLLDDRADAHKKATVRVELPATIPLRVLERRKTIPSKESEPTDQP